VCVRADYGYWQTISDERALTARIALFDEDEDNGCMQVLPGSHTWPQVFVAGARYCLSSFASHRRNNVADDS
jgi:ectoine hydroxylase-related dioxygenase (phytanoyl-CoA dioxygenase family)